jgi:two-component system chemotaxis response regulator CheB
MNSPRKVRVLVVDDSAVVRRSISDTLGRDPELEVVGTACDPYVARDQIIELKPDVLTLDMEMPRMDGLTFLRVLQKHHPMPVIVISSVTTAGSQLALDALAAGAVDVIAKPTSAWSIAELGEQLPHRVKAAARARFVNLRTPAPPGETVRPAPPPRPHGNPRALLLIGASTGGTEAIKRVLTALPGGMPGICVVQHIPPVFSTAFAKRLNDSCQFEVREAANGDKVLPGLALIAPGGYHMSLSFEGGHYRVSLGQGPPLHFTRPAVDVLFNSAAPWAGPDTVAALLTGMGADGALGMQRLRQKGARTIAQNEATCVVFGMPRAAIELGAAERVLPLDEIPGALLDALRHGSGERQSNTNLP